MNARDTVKLILEDTMNLFPEYRQIRVAFLTFDALQIIESELPKKTELDLLTLIAKVEGRIDTFRKARVRASPR